MTSKAASANDRAKCDFPTCRAPRNTNGLRPARVRQFNNSSSALRFIYAILAGDFNIKSEISAGNFMIWLEFDNRGLRARNANSLFDVRLREIM